MEIFPLFSIIITTMLHGICSQMVGTKPPPTTTITAAATCPSINEITSAMEKLFDAQTTILTKKLAEIEARLQDLTPCNSIGSSELFLGIYENLTIFDDWILLYDKPYEHSTTSRELEDVANNCGSNRIVVGAMENKNSTVLYLAAVGPKRVLYLNNTAEKPEEIENVLWVLESGKTFGYQPSENTLSGSAQSELFLSWYVDANYGGWRAGKNINLHQNSIWRKVIYCMPTFKS